MTGDAAVTPTLRTYLAQLSEAGDLVEVERRVSGHHELSAVVKALEPLGAPAVRFHSVADSDLPVVSGLFGRRSRVADALGVGVREAVEHVLERMAHPVPPVTVGAASAPVQQVVQTGDDVDLDALPIGVHAAQDAGRYITAGVTLFRDPQSGATNTGIYRLMVVGRRRITVNAAPDHDLGRAIRRAAEAGEDLPVAIVIGHHPAYLIASQLKNPASVDTHAVTGALLDQPLEVVRARTVDLDVPAAAEIVLEGVIRCRDVVPEGPFGEFSYYYGSGKSPVCEITAVTRRVDAIYHDLHATHAEHRCLWLFPGREARLLESLRAMVPGVRAVRIPFYGGALSAYLALDKSHDGDGKQAMLGAFARDHFLKHVIAVDSDIDIWDDTAVLWAVNVRFQADRDLVVLDQVKGIRMDPSAARLEVGGRVQAVTSKLGIDATRPVVGFPERADLPAEPQQGLRLTDYVSSDRLAQLELIPVMQARNEE